MAGQRINDIPARILWAVDQVLRQDVKCVLEIGCGRGHFIRALGSTGAPIHVTGVDRSAAAAKAAAAMNVAAIEAGLASVVHAGLESYNSDARFDAVVAINVNLFWLGAVEPLRALTKIMARNGVLLISIEAPSPRQAERAAAGLRDRLPAAGFHIETLDVSPQASWLGCIARADTKSATFESRHLGPVASCR